MKIAIRGGHNFQAVGASGIIDETTEDRKVKDAVIKYLRASGHNVLDVTPGDCDVNTDLAYGVNSANRFGAELFASIHFNKAYDSYSGAIGTEVWIYSTGGKAEPIATRVVKKISSETGLKNRGVKTSTSLYELRKTTMPAMIIEVCFVEATEDVRIYNEKGYDLIGKCIAEAITDNTIDGVEDYTKPNPQGIQPDVMNSIKNKNTFMTNATAQVALDARDKGEASYIDIGEIYANERIQILAEVCDKEYFLPVIYWKDELAKASEKVWVNSKQEVLAIDTNASVINVVTELDARYEPLPESPRMGYVNNGERLFVHKSEGDYVLATYFAGVGYKTAYFTEKYIEMD
ncbi:N-acetylmuramoyl-L-alanine amidase [Clostridium sp. YIM B02505]|uniref:N-acetylmuramoyl-L-alanine amidase n=1 Tax=Clostridium yunnanense TaxID=2800325 RepID=A0ABS1EML6_9CLOT|nr:N-acetylmuramoyl-L-alanine amidase [Clostridium yunnanense]MBK1810538.1 N-acetylmuramoyl-L-alanine amidase [Clostridium yunnanense]